MASRFGSRTALLAAVALLPFSAAAAETRTYVVSWFYDASYYGGDEDCPDGLNLSSIDFYRRDLARVGHSHDEIEAALKDFPGEGGLKQPWVPMVMVRGNGKDNVYVHPETAPDPMLKTVKGRFAYGFNLDGKGAASPQGFEEPATHEKGVDNQWYRATGCIRSYRSVPAKDVSHPPRPDLPETHWDILRNSMPAWLLMITAANGFGHDGDATVTLARATDRVTRAGADNGVQPDMTYTMDPDPRSRNVLKAHLKGSTIAIDPAPVSMPLDPYVAPTLQFTNTHMRLALTEDGRVRGFVGGYMPWYPIWFGIARSGYITEYAASIDLPGLYYALKKLADGDPDPKTGENRAVSATYAIEAVPAFVAKDAKTASR